MINIEVIFNNTETSAKYNKDLITYFKNNIGRLNNNGLKFIWKVAEESEYEFYEQKGITNFPAAIVNEKVVYGVKNIISDISKLTQSSRTKSFKRPIDEEIINNDNFIKEYQEKLITSKDDFDEDETDNWESNHRKKEQDYFKRRQMAGMPEFDEGNKNTTVGNINGMDMNSMDTNSRGKFSSNMGGGDIDNLHYDSEHISKLERTTNSNPDDSLNRLRHNPNVNSQDMDLMQIHLDKMDANLNMDYF